MLPTIPAPAQIRQHATRDSAHTVLLPHVAARTHRRCAPEHAAWVEAHALSDHQVLPRWHQADRRRGRSRSTGGFHQVAPEGAYSGIPVWNGLNHWLDVVVPTAVAVHRDKLRGRVSLLMFRRWARLKAAYVSQQRTGRQCIARPDTIASVLGCDLRTVQRCQAVAREIGLEVVVAKGRMLTMAERLAAQRRGSTQRGLSTEVALTIPRDLPRHMWIVTPSSGSPGEMKSHPAITSLSVASDEKKAAASPRQPQRRGRDARRARSLAAEVAQIVPWLAGERTGRLAPALTRFATAQPAWQAQEISHALADLLRRRSIDPAQLTADRIRSRPAVVLARLLGQLDVQADHPRMDAFADATWTPAPVVVQPCGHPDCDGHGWINLVAGAAVKCPRCPPQIRAWDAPDDDNGQGEPLF